jgi:hypothetical protein
MADQSKSPELGEQTGPQKDRPILGSLNGTAGMQVGISTMNTGAQTDLRAPAGSFETYRVMRRNPTIALARAIATAPILSARWSVEATDDADAEIVSFVQQQMDRLWADFVSDALFCFDYGFQSWEKVFAVADLNGRQYIVLDKLKPLAPDITQYRADKDTGAFAGVRNGDVDLDSGKCLWLANEPEAGNPFGASRLENIRKTAWYPWERLGERKLQYAARVAGVTPMIEYPEGESLDASGAKRSNFLIACALLDALGRGKGITMPNVFSSFAGDLARSGVDLDKLRAWRIDFLETKTAHGDDLIQMAKHYESLMMRGFLAPERSGTEAAQSGSRADSKTHGDIALLISQLSFMGFLRLLNRDVVNPLIAVNFGPQHQDHVYLTSAGLDPELLAFFRSVMTTVFAGNVDLLLSSVDFDAMLDATGLPKSEEVVDPSAVDDEGDEKPDPNQPPANDQQPPDKSKPPKGKAGASMTAAVRSLYRRLHAKT